MGTTFLRGGLDSFTAVNTGISNKLGIGLGVYQLAVNLVIFIFILWLDRKQIGIGTILNMVLVGFEIQWFTTIYHQLFGYRTTFLIVAADTLIGLILFTLGCIALHGTGPWCGTIWCYCTNYHAKNEKLSYRTARITQDVLFMVAAVMLLSHIGKRTYHTIYNALQTTETMRNNMSEYSTSDLRSQLKIVRRNMANSKEMDDSFVEQERLLQDELNKRIAKAKKVNKPNK